MQYLSKAYNYYSGINPATLSGAIDVIVVKHVDKDGTVTLSSSPFHVRFGKLQVLRAGEKRVTIKLPNNLPSPHVAPFSMKVGETGEAFFVFETDENVPEDLLTSPVVMPLEDELDTSSDTHSDHLDDEKAHPDLITKEPFGDTERQEKAKQDALDSDILDLNQSVETLKVSSDTSPIETTTPSSILNVLPSIPFLSSSSSSKNSSPEKKTKSSSTTSTPPKKASPPQSLPSTPSAEAGPSKTLRPPNSKPNPPPNPVAESPQKAKPPIINHKLENVGAEDLPTVPKGGGIADRPEVRYGKDVVLDMAGYHADTTQQINKDSSSEGRSRPQNGTVTPDTMDEIASTLLSTLTEDLTNSARALTDPSRPSLLPHRRTDPSGGSLNIPAESPDDIEAGLPQMPRKFSLDRDRHVRATSEPPETPPREIPSPQSFRSRPTSPGLSFSRTPNGTITFPRSPTPPTAKGVMDLTWDMRNRANSLNGVELSDEREGEVEGEAVSLHHIDRIRSESMPIHTAGPGRLKNVEENPHLFVLEMGSGRSHTFELSLCGSSTFASKKTASDEEETAFFSKRITFQQFIEDPQMVDDPALVLRYSLLYLSWTTGYDVLLALSMYRRSLTPPSSIPNNLSSQHDNDLPAAPTRTSGYGWSRWWRRGQSAVPPSQPPPAPSDVTSPLVAESQATLVSTSVPVSPKPGVIKEDETNPPSIAVKSATPAESGTVTPTEPAKYYAKTLRLASDQLKTLNLHPGPNTISFSVTSSYSGQAICTSRIFLWESTDQIVISDIDGTITKSDALGHVFAAIGRDWTHLGIARLYTDIANNGYKILYLTSRAIGQADSTREYLKSINQGEYRMPEGPVIMSPDRLMASLHREVIMRKPELFKMACLRDIQRLFGPDAKEAFYAGFGNRITDAMSYRSVGIETSKIYTIDSTGVVKTELLQAAGHKGSYILLNDLVNEVFPPVSTKFKPEYTDFNYWRIDIPDIPLPDLSPPSPALSARSDSSMSVLSKIIGRRSSKQPILPTTHDPSSRPSSPLIGPALSGDEIEDDEDSSGEDEFYVNGTNRIIRLDDDREGGRKSRRGSTNVRESRSASRNRKREKSSNSMPGSFEVDKGSYFPSSLKNNQTLGDDADHGMLDVEAQTRSRVRRRSMLSRESGRKEDQDNTNDGDDQQEGGDNSKGEIKANDYDDDDTIFDDDILAAGEMRNVPF